MHSQTSTDPEANKRRAFFSLEGKRGVLQQEICCPGMLPLRTQGIVTDFRGPLILDVLFFRSLACRVMVR